MTIADFDGNGFDDLLVGNLKFGSDGAAVVFADHGIFADDFESGDLSGWSAVEQ